MKNNTTLTFNPEKDVEISPLDEIVRNGAQQLLEKALEIEVSSFL